MPCSSDEAEEEHVDLVEDLSVSRETRWQFPTHDCEERSHSVRLDRVTEDDGDNTVSFSESARSRSQIIWGDERFRLFLRDLTKVVDEGSSDEEIGSTRCHSSVTSAVHLETVHT